MVEECFYDHNTGRWLCPDKILASECARKHPGEYVFTYKRDKQGNIKDVTEYWSPRGEDNIKISAIRGGKLRLKT